jgi:hypothetical protein
MLFGKKTKIYAPNISANVEADVDAKMKKGGEKGAKALIAALKKQGYKNGGENTSLLNKMTYGGGIDMSEKLVNTMRGAGKKMQIGGSTYSGPKKKK